MEEEYSRADVVGVYRVSVAGEDLYAVVLSCEGWESTVLPIFIGQFEAVAIQSALEGVRMRRPMTHDLIANILDAVGVSVEKVTIDALVDNLFTATIVLKDGGGRRWHIDARPSDSIAIALRTSSPIYVADRLREYGIPAEDLAS